MVVYVSMPVTEHHAAAETETEAREDERQENQNDRQVVAERGTEVVVLAVHRSVPLLVDEGIHVVVVPIRHLSAPTPTWLCFFVHSSVRSKTLVPRVIHGRDDIHEIQLCSFGFALFLSAHYAL